VRELVDVDVARHRSLCCVVRVDVCVEGYNFRCDVVVVVVVVCRTEERRLPSAPKALVRRVACGKCVLLLLLSSLSLSLLSSSLFVIVPVPESLYSD
jgi:hypothetical protein